VQPRVHLVSTPAARAPASPSPPPKPEPPPGPRKVRWDQLTAQDFLRPETIETLFYLWRATGAGCWRGARVVG
jgi:hypothetical protein